MIFEENILLERTLYSPVKLAKTILRNHSTILSDFQLKQILNLLYDDYKYLGMTVSIYDHPDQVIADRQQYGDEYIDDWCYEDSVFTDKDGLNEINKLPLLEGNIYFQPYKIIYGKDSLSILLKEI